MVYQGRLSDRVFHALLFGIMIALTAAGLVLLFAGIILTGIYPVRADSGNPRYGQGWRKAGL